MTNRKTGDCYIENENGKFIIRIAREDGNDGYAGIDGMFGGIRYFETEKAAQDYLDSKRKKTVELPQSNKNYIFENRNGRVEKGFLYGNDGGRIKLVGLNLEYYTSLKTA